MAEKTYTVRHPESGKTVTFKWHGATDPSDSDLDEIFASAKADKGSVSQGMKDEVREQVGGLKELGSAALGVGKHLTSSQDRGATIKGFFSGMMEGVRRLPLPIGIQPIGQQAADPSLLDPTGAASIFQRNEPTRNKVGRGLVLAAESALPFSKQLARAAKGTKAGGQAARGVPVAKGGFGTSVMGTPSKDVVSLGQMADDAAPMSGVGRVEVAKPKPSSFQKTTGMQVPSGPIIGAGGGGFSRPAPGGSRTAQEAANLAAKAEQAAEGIKPPYAGPERRGAGRIQTEVEDRAYQTVRRQFEERQARERARGVIGQVKVVPKPPATKTLYRVEPKDLGDQGEWLKKHLSPEQYEKFVSERGRLFSDDLEVAKKFGHGEPTHNTWTVNVPEDVALKAKRAHPDGYTEYLLSPEDVGRKQLFGAQSQGAVAAQTPVQGSKKLGGLAVKTAETKGKKTTSLAEMEKLYGTEEAAKRAGMSVDEFAARAGGASTPEQLAAALRDRLGAVRAGRLLGISPEEVRKLSGGGPSKIPTKAVEQIKAGAPADVAQQSPLQQLLLERIKNERGAIDPKLLAVLAGGAGGAALNPDDPALGALLGTGAGLGVANIGKAGRLGKIALDLRREGFLTGAAIPKNIASALGGAAALSAEKGSTAPIKEMLRLPTNFKKAKDAWQNPKHQFESHVAGERSGLPKWGPSRVISAIDETASEALTRAGIPVEDIERILLTRENNAISKAITNATTEETRPIAQKIGQAILPFQRTPANVVSEGIGEVAHAVKNPKTARAAVTIASPALGWAIGEWAKENPVQRGPLAAIALAALGSRSGIATLAGSTVAGRQVLGGVSPIPEMAFDLNTAWGWPPAGLKLWNRLMKGEQ